MQSEPVAWKLRTKNVVSEDRFQGSEEVGKKGEGVEEGRLEMEKVSRGCSWTGAMGWTMTQGLDVDGEIVDEREDAEAERKKKRERERKESL